jgi:hypothetical protein
MDGYGVAKTGNTYVVFSHKEHHKKGGLKNRFFG